MDIIDTMTAEEITAFGLHISQRLDTAACEGCDRFESLRGPTLCIECVGCFRESERVKK